MKYIRKRGMPHDYALWRRKVKGTQDEHFENGLKNPLKRELHEALIREQGFLCAYTMKRIGEYSSHIEHIKPETLCRRDCVGSDLDYKNMVACFPRKGMPRRFRYGAQARGDWWDNGGAEFVTPLHANCEKRFNFDLEGRIEAVNGNAAAKKTIEKLGLAHNTLIEDRRRVIREFIYGENGDAPLPVATAKRSSGEICRASTRGVYHEFCVAIRDALRQHLKDLEKLSKRRKFARKKKNA